METICPFAEALEHFRLIYVRRICEYDPVIQTRIVSEYDQEIPQSQTADNPVAPRGRAAQPSRQGSGLHWPIRSVVLAFYSHKRIYYSIGIEFSHLLVTHCINGSILV